MAVISRDSIIFELLLKANSKELRNVDNQLGGFQKQLNTASDTFKGFLGAQALIAASKGLAELAKAPIQIAASFEETRNSFGTLLGDFEKADALLRELTRLDLESPFDPQDFQQGAQTLLGFGRTASEVVEDLELLGNAAATSTTASLQSLSLVFGQIQGANRLLSQDANQLINQGIPIYDLLAESLGKSVQEVRNLQSQGKIAGDDVTEAFRKASEEGGRFEGALERQSQSLNGLFSTLTGNIGQIAQRLGRVINPIIKQVAGVGIGITSSILDSLSPFTDLVEANIAPVLEQVGEILSPIGEAFREISQEIFGLVSTEQAVSGFFNIILGGAQITRDLLRTIVEVIRPAASGIRDLLNSFTGFTGFNPIIEVVDLVIDNIVFLGSSISRVIGILARWTSALLGLTSNSDGIRNYFKFVTGLYGSLRNVITGVIEAIGAMPKAIINGIARTVVSARIKLEEAKQFFGASNQEFIDNLKKEQAQLSQGYETVAEAFKRGVKESKELAEGINLPTFKDVDIKPIDDAGKSLDDFAEKTKEATGLTEKQQKAIDKLNESLFKLRQEAEKAAISDDPIGTLFVNAEFEIEEVRRRQAEFIKTLKETRAEAGQAVEQSELNTINGQFQAIIDSITREAKENVRQAVEETFDFRIQDVLDIEEVFGLSDEELRKLLDQGLRLEDILNPDRILSAEQIQRFRDLGLEYQDILLSLNGESQLGALRDTIGTIKNQIEELGTPTNVQDLQFLNSLKANLKEAEDLLDQFEKDEKSKINVKVELDREEIKKLITQLEGELAGIDTSDVAGKGQAAALKARIEGLNGILNSGLITTSLADLLGLEDDQLKDINTAFDLISDGFDALLQRRFDSLDALVEKRKSSVEELRKIAVDGNAEQLQIEEERLEKLLNQRERALQRQRQLQAIETGLQATGAIATGIAAITRGAAELGPAGVIAQIAAITAGILTLVSAIQSAFSNIPSFKKGTKRFQGGDLDSDGGALVIGHKGERWVQTHINNQIPNNIENEQLPGLVKDGLKYRSWLVSNLPSGATLQGLNRSSLTAQRINMELSSNRPLELKLDKMHSQNQRMYSQNQRLINQNRGLIAQIGAKTVHVDINTNAFSIMTKNNSKWRKESDTKPSLFAIAKSRVNVKN